MRFNPSAHPRVGVLHRGKRRTAHLHPGMTDTVRLNLEEHKQMQGKGLREEALSGRRRLLCVRWAEGPDAVCVWGPTTRDVAFSWWS